MPHDRDISAVLQRSGKLVSFPPLPPTTQRVANSGHVLGVVRQTGRIAAKSPSPDAKLPGDVPPYSRPNRHETVPIWVPISPERFPYCCHPSRIGSGHLTAMCLRP